MRVIYLTPFLLQFLIFCFLPYRAIPQGSNVYTRNIDPYHPDYDKGKIIIKFYDVCDITFEKKGYVYSTGYESIDKIFKSYGVQNVANVFQVSKSAIKNKSAKDGSVKLSSIYVIEFDLNLDAMSLCELFNENPLVEYAEPDYYVYSMITEPNDALYQSGMQWYLQEIKAPEGWDSITCDTTEIIGIIDTGIDWDHPDLDGNIWRNWSEIAGNGYDDDNNGYIDDIRGWDFVNNDNDPNDDNGHGTHVAGIAAAETDNYIGIAGIAWKAKLMPLKVLSGNGQGSTSRLANAILYAYYKGATVINMSLGTYGESQTVKVALEIAYDTAFLVAAAGNEGCKVDTLAPPYNPYAPMYPACYPFVAGVEAATDAGLKATFTNFDPSGFVQTANKFGYNYEIRAPGINIFSTFPNGTYMSLSGTSMATPIVSGTVALVKNFKPGISNEELFARLVSFSENGNLKIPNILNSTLEPDLHFVEFSLVDTIGIGDNDGQADAGEVIQIYYTVKNSGGYADSIHSFICLDYPDDSTLITLIDTTSYIGDLDSSSYHGDTIAYTTLTGERDPFKVLIRSNVINERDIVFRYKIGAKNTSQTTGTFVLKVFNGQEISGVVDTTLVLTPDRLWLVNNSFKLTTTGVLKLLPGTHLKINKAFINKGWVIGEGKPDSLIIIEGPQNFGGWANIVGNVSCKYTKFVNIIGPFYLTNFVLLDHCYFLDFGNFSIFNNCDFNIRDSYFSGLGAVAFWGGGSAIRSVFDNFPGGTFGRGGYNLQYNNFSNKTGPFVGAAGSSLYKNNFQTSEGNIIYWAEGNYDFDYKPNQYWGTTDENKIDKMIWDFWDNALLPVIVYQPILEQPTDSAHGIVWKILLNGVNPWDDYLDPIGVGKVRFDVFFNKPMDTLVEPLLTFGVREPFTQHLVMDGSSWSADSTTWTAYYDIEIETGDGMNFIRVDKAIDTEGFKIPAENTGRFKFIIQAAASSSLQFIATPGIGKVFLEWPYPDTPDFLGFNMYRFIIINDSIATDTVLVNASLITDSTFIDYNVVPGLEYNYCYKIVGTDMVESDYSRVVSAVPLSSANGDANGDQQVNVLDITSMIAYILGQNPQPFLFEAADLNYDLSVNILDVILLVNIIIGNKSLDNYNDPLVLPSQLYIYENSVRLKNYNYMAGLQFEIQGEHIYNQKPICNLEGWEFSYSVVGDKMICILYSFSGNRFSPGVLELISFDSDVRLKLRNAIGADSYGKELTVLIGNDTVSIMACPNLSISPNPFSQSTEIKYKIDEPSEIIIRIFDNLGHVVYFYTEPQTTQGTYSLIWKSTNNLNAYLPAGVYHCCITVIPNSHADKTCIESKTIVHLD